MGGKRIPIFDRLEKGLKAMPNGCWEWQGSCTVSGGYGHMSCGSDGPIRTHRALWEIVFGSIPDDLCVLHKCDNPPCANPAHLFLGTRAVNNADMRRKGRHVVQRSGESSNSKLTWEKVRAIRTDTRSNLEIGTDYEIDPSHVSKIKLGKRWKE